MSNNTAVLLIKCQDQKGLVAAISKLLSENGINIIDLQQHTDEVNVFYQRIYFDMAEMTIDRIKLESLLKTECGRLQID